MIRISLTVFFVLIALSVEQAWATRALTSSQVTQSPECRGKQTNFPAESTGQLSRRRSGNDRGLRANLYARNPNEATRNGLCGMSTNQEAASDTAQAIVSADILTQTKRLMTGQLDRLKTTLESHSACLNQDSCYREKLNGNNTFVSSNLSQFQIMRSKLAISQVNASCVENGYAADLRSRTANYVRCLRGVQLAHPRGMLERASNYTGLTSAQYGTNIEPLSGTEIGNLADWLAANTPATRGRGAATSLADLQKSAQQSYQGMLIENPMLRYLESSNPARADFQRAHQRTLSDLNAARQQIQNKPLQEMRSYGVAIQSVLTNIPERFRGDYCEVANHLITEQSNLESSHDMRLLGLSVLPFGMAGLAARGATGLASIANGANFLQGYGRYRDRVRECVAASSCTASELESASQITELDYLAAGITVGGPAGMRFVKFLARNPSAAARVESLVASDGLNGAARALERVPETCLTSTVEVNRHFVKAYLIFAPTPAFACNMNAVGSSSRIAQDSASGSRSASAGDSAARRSAGASDSSTSSTTGAGASAQRNSASLPPLSRPVSPDRVNEIFSRSWQGEELASTANVTGRTNLGSGQGAANLRIETAYMDGRRVFLKTTQDSLADARAGGTSVEVEALWTRTLAEMGVGPRYHGVTGTDIPGRGTRATIITDFVEGDHLQPNRFTQYRGRNGPDVQQQITEIGRRLDRAGIRADDLQFRVTAEGRVYVVDPSDFRMLGPGENNDAYVQLFNNFLQSQPSR